MVILEDPDPVLLAVSIKHSNSTLNNTITMTVNLVSIKDALKIIHEFDAENIPISEFFLGCDEAKEMIDPDNEVALVNFIWSKIKGDALISLQGQSFNSIKRSKRSSKSNVRT